MQAKKIQASSSRYASLTHEVAGTPQIDILDAYASSNQALAIYCFYNYSTKPYIWNCNLPLELEQLGCSVAPSSIVRQAISEHGAKNFTYMHLRKETLPWRCLLRCPNFISKTAPGHTGWPSLSECFHQRLPPVLQQIWKQGGQFSFVDQPELFNSNNRSRPKWVGIVDVDDKVRSN